MEEKDKINTIEGVKEIIRKNKITDVDEAFNKVTEIVKGIPNIQGNMNKVFLARGQVLELSTIIEISFNELFFNLGYKKIPSDFMKKAKLVEELMLKGVPGIEIKREEFEIFQDFVSLRNIFAHAPINWFSLELEFENGKYYKHLFERNPEWKKFSFAIEYFVGICGQTIELIKGFVKVYLTQKKMEEEINKAVFGNLPKEIIEELKKIQEEESEEKKETE